jgi:hypothetical protein
VHLGGAAAAPVHPRAPAPHPTTHPLPPRATPAPCRHLLPPGRPHRPRGGVGQRALLRHARVLWRQPGHPAAGPGAWGVVLHHACAGMQGRVIRSSGRGEGKPRQIHRRCRIISTPGWASSGTNRRWDGSRPLTPSHRSLTTTQLHPSPRQLGHSHQAPPAWPPRAGGGGGRGVPPTPRTALPTLALPYLLLSSPTFLRHIITIVPPPCPWPAQALGPSASAALLSGAPSAAPSAMSGGASAVPSSASALAMAMMHHAQVGSSIHASTHQRINASTLKQQFTFTQSTLAMTGRAGRAGGLQHPRIHLLKLKQQSTCTQSTLALTGRARRGGLHHPLTH